MPNLLFVLRINFIAISLVLSTTLNLNFLKFHQIILILDTISTNVLGKIKYKKINKVDNDNVTFNPIVIISVIFFFFRIKINNFYYS